MSENYQNKYQQVFHQDSKCIVMNDPQFHGNVTIIAGQTKGLPPTSQKVKEAIETVDKEGLLTEDNLWWAIYRVLTMPEFGYPNGKPEFCKSIENLAPEVSHKCVYNNWRNFTPSKLKASPDKWEPIENLGDAEARQRRVGIRLLELLGSPSRPPRGEEALVCNERSNVKALLHILTDVELPWARKYQ